MYIQMPDGSVNLIVEEFVDNVKIAPKDIANNMEESILKVLRRQKEGICSNHGFIKQGSIKILEISGGKLELTSFHGYMNYTVKYSANVCNPVKDNIVSAKVCNVNDFGILCTSLVKDDSGAEIPVLEIIVPKHSPAIVSAVNLDDIKIHQSVMIQIVGKKYQLGNSKISIIGKIVVDESARILLDKDTSQTIAIESDEEVDEVHGDTDSEYSETDNDVDSVADYDDDSLDGDEFEIDDISSDEVEDDAAEVEEDESP